MKKIYEVPAMEIVRLDASENIAKLPTIDSSSTTSTTESGGRLVTTTRSSSLVAALANLAGGNTSSVEA